jgi:uncharacterized protein (TIGR02118 family)
MAKVIFVLQRRAGLTREQALAHWSGEQHAAIVGKLPGLTRYVQNHVSSAPAEPVCDGIGELWFATDHLMNQALNSPEMAAAVEDAKRFLDMERTGMILVQEKILVGLSAPPATPDDADATTLIVRRARHAVVAILARTMHPAHRPALIWAASLLIALQPIFMPIGNARTSS